MAFRDFRYPEVQRIFGLTQVEKDLYSQIPPWELESGFLERMQYSIKLGLAINTEKARSEFIIAPILLEVRRLLGGRFGLFSGIEFDVDSSRGLNGYCDFILTRSPLQYSLNAPIVAIAEAKNDNLRNGFGQCISSMVAAREFNAAAEATIPTVFGVVTTGSAWQFFRLDGSVLTLDSIEYYVDDLSIIVGILAHILQSA